MNKEESSIYYLFRHKFTEEWLNKQSLCVVNELRLYLTKLLETVNRVYAQWQDD